MSAIMKVVYRKWCRHERLIENVGHAPLTIFYWRDSKISFNFIPLLLNKSEIRNKSFVAVHLFDLRTENKYDQEYCTYRPKWLETKEKFSVLTTFSGEKIEIPQKCKLSLSLRFYFTKGDA